MSSSSTIEISRPADTQEAVLHNDAMTINGFKSGRVRRALSRAGAAKAGHIADSPTAPYRSPVLTGKEPNEAPDISGSAGFAINTYKRPELR